MKYLKITAFFICILFISLSSFRTGAVDEREDIGDLKKRISELENRIKDLEALLKIYKKPVEKGPDKSNGWWNKKSWASLKKGMSKKKVKEILGDPVQTVKGKRAIWYYPNLFRGYVSFDENGNLSGWIEP